MDDKTIEQIIIKAVEIGVYNTLSQLGLTSEVITEAQARKKYGRRLIAEWRSKRWIVGYPTGNLKKSKSIFQENRTRDSQQDARYSEYHSFK